MTVPPPSSSWGTPGASAPGGSWGPPPGTIYPGSSPTAAQTTSGLAVASLVTGVFFCMVVPGIVAVVLGHLALEKIKDSGGQKRGRGMAIAGIVLGWVGLGILGLSVLSWFLTVLTS